MSDDRCDLLCLDLPQAEELRKTRLDPATADRLAAAAKALSDPTRLTLVATLLDGSELCVCDLTWILERSQGLVSHHLRTLRSAGLVDSRRDGKLVMYSLNDLGREVLAATMHADEAAAT